MCYFYSCIIDSKGKIYDKLGVNSHTRLEEIYGLRDNGIYERAKIEVIPVKGIDKPIDTWEFLIDEKRIPSWWNDGYKGLVLGHIKKNVIKNYYNKTKKGYKQYGWYDNGEKWYEDNYVNGELR